VKKSERISDFTDENRWSKAEHDSLHSFTAVSITRIRMAFCCSSVSSSDKHDTGASGTKKSNPYKAANAAVDISNLTPRSKVPAFSTSLFSHSRIPTAGVREHPSGDGKSVATSWINGRSTPSSDRELHPSPTAAEVATLYSVPMMHVCVILQTDKVAYLS
jgi:hypothetical protein